MLQIVQSKPPVQQGSALRILDLPRRREINTGNACTLNDFVFASFFFSLSLLLRRRSFIVRVDRLLRVKAQVGLTSTTTLSVWLHPFIYFKSRERRLVREYSLFLLRWPVLLSRCCCRRCCCCVKTAIVTKCSFVCGPQGLMGYYPEWLYSPRVQSLEDWRDTNTTWSARPPLSLSSHFAHHPNGGL